MNQTNPEKQTTLTEKMQPCSFTMIQGHSDLTNLGTAFWSKINFNDPFSIFMTGPKGSGKKTIAKTVAIQSHTPFIEIDGSAVTKEIIPAKYQNRKCLLILTNACSITESEFEPIKEYMASTQSSLIATDSIDQKNAKTKWLSLIPEYVTTLLTEKDIENILVKTLISKNGFGGNAIYIDSPAISYIAELAAGKAGAALAILEKAFYLSETDETGYHNITFNNITNAAIETNNAHLSDSCELHYMLKRAILQSNKNAAVYYLYRCKMLEPTTKNVIRLLQNITARHILINDITAASSIETSCKYAKMTSGSSSWEATCAAILYACDAKKSDDMKISISNAKAVFDATGSVPVKHLIKKRPNCLPKPISECKIVPDKIQKNSKTDNNGLQSKKKTTKTLKQNPQETIQTDPSGTIQPDTSSYSDVLDFFEIHSPKERKYE